MMKKAIKDRMIKRPREWYDLADVERLVAEPDTISKQDWESWSLRQRAHYYRVLDDLWESRKAFFHPKTPVMEDEQFLTVAHNAAWTAAEQLD